MRAIGKETPHKFLLRVIFHTGTLDAVMRHASSDFEHEVGGVLLGRVEPACDSLSVEVTDIIQACHTRATRTSITFTPETWIDITCKRKAIFPGKKIVGWYHSHLGLSTFLSNLDWNFHWCLFQGKPWYVAMVVDPVCRKWELFAWHDEKERKEIVRLDFTVI